MCHTQTLEKVRDEAVHRESESTYLLRDLPLGFNCGCGLWPRSSSLFLAMNVIGTMLASLRSKQNSFSVICVVAQL